MKVITNNHRRDIVYWHELTDAEKTDFDWITDSDTMSTDGAEFFRYKGDVYCLSDFMRDDGNHFPGWDGYTNDSFYSGVLVRYPIEDRGDIDSDHVIVGWFYS